MIAAAQIRFQHVGQIVGLSSSTRPQVLTGSTKRYARLDERSPGIPVA